MILALFGQITSMTKMRTIKMMIRIQWSKTKTSKTRKIKVLMTKSSQVQSAPAFLCQYLALAAATVATSLVECTSIP